MISRESNDTRYDNFEKELEDKLFWSSVSYNLIRGSGYLFILGALLILLGQSGNVLKGNRD